MHGARMLPSAVVPNRPSARDPGTAEQCEPPELDRPAQETQPGRQRPRRFLGSKYRQQLPRRRHRPADPPSCARPKEGYFPYLWRLSFVLLADAIGL